MKMLPFDLYSNYIEAKELWKARRHSLFAGLEEGKTGAGAQLAIPSQGKDGEDADWKMLEGC